MLTAGVPLLSQRQLIGNSHHSCWKHLLLYMDTRDGKGKRRWLEQVLSLRISAETFPQPAETTFQESNPVKEQLRTSLVHFPWADSTQELGDRRRADLCSAVALPATLPGQC